MLRHVGKKPGITIPFRGNNHFNMSPAFNFLKRSGFFISIIAFSACSPGKSLVKTDTETLRNIQKHVGFLADDKLEGRRTGTPGEELAAEYIAARFREYDISPKGTEYYTQSFIVNDGKKIDSSTSLIINGTKLEAGTGFFPFPYSPDITIEALPSIAV